MSLPNFSALRDLHNSANDLLHSPGIQRVLVHQKQELWLHDVSEASLRMLDVCGISKDILLLVKEHLLDLKSLKGMKTKSLSSDVDVSLMVVVEALREVRVTTISIVESLLSLISIPWLDQKTTKGSFRAKFLRSSCQSLHDYCDEAALHSADKRLEAVEIAIEDLEAELECMSRRLIQTRVSLLNILNN